MRALSVRSPFAALIAGAVALLLAVTGLAVPASAATLSATATDFSWGFKQGFRNYITGPPAGTVTPSAGASFADSGAPTTSPFLFTGGASSFDPDAATGSAQLTGTVAFLKPLHGINLSVSNPRVEFAGGTANVFWTPKDGAEVLGATASTVALGAPVTVGANSTVAVSASGVAFTAAGSAPFTYSAGEPLEPFTFSLTYASPITATPTSTTLSASSTSVVTGGAVQLSAVIPSTIAGSVTFLDGQTPVATVAASGVPVMPNPPAPQVLPTVSTVTAVAPGLSAGSHSFTAVFTPTDAVTWAASSSAAVAVTTVAGPATLTGNVSGAQLEWGFSDYSQVGGANPATTTAPSSGGWPIVAVTGGAERVSPSASSTSLGFRLTGGTGSADPATGIGSISYPGTVTYAPYNYALTSGEFTLSGMVLTTTSTTQGSLTGFVSWRAVQGGDLIGPMPVTLATFGVSSLTGSAGSFTLQTGAPDYAGTVAAGTYSPGFSSAWPASLVSAIPSAFRAFFYQSGTTQGNLNKPPKPLTASFVATAATSVSLATSSASVISGGSVQLSATVPADVAGVVEFFDGATSVGTATATGVPVMPSPPAPQVLPTTTTLGLVASGLATGSHTFSAVLTPTDTAQWGVSVSNTGAVSAVAAPAAVTGNVSGAQLEWGFSDYSQVGGANPATTTAPSSGGWPVVAVTGGAERVSASGSNTSLGFRLTGGTGAVDPATGAGSISFPGTVTYAPYNYALSSGEFTLSQMTLTTSGTQGTLTGSVSWRAGQGTAVIGPIPVTLATFGVSSLAGTAGSFTLQTNAPDYAGTAAAGTYSPGYTSAWPPSLVSAIPSAFRAFFYQSGTTQGNLNKPPKPLTASFSAVAIPTAVSISSSQTTGLVAGDTVTLRSSVSPSSAVGVVRVLLDGTEIAAGPAGAPLTVTSPALVQGTHSVTAEFVPANPLAFGASGSPSLSLRVTAVPTAPAGRLVWGVHAPFTQYVTGPTAQGTVTASNGATAAGGTFTFAQAAGGTYDSGTGLGSVDYRGAIRYYGHHGALDLTLASPVVRIDSATAATLLATVGGSSVEFASVNLASASRTTSGSSVTYTAAPVTLLAGGAAFFGSYPAGTPLDPMTFTVGSATTPPVDPPVDPEPVATTTALVASQVDGLQVGDLVALTTTVIPRTATGTVSVSLDGAVIGSGPAGSSVSVQTAALTAGVHRVVATFTPSSDAYLASSASLTLTVAAPVTPPAGSLTWGVSSAFTSYITGPIADGSITIGNGVSEQGGEFTFQQTGGSTFTAKAGTGSANYRGAIRYVGHGGALDLKLSNPVVVITSATSGTILVTTGGEQVAFGSLDLSAGSRTEAAGTVSFGGVPVTLLAAGAAFFGGNYPVGTLLSPLSFTIGSASAVEPTGSTTIASTVAPAREPAATPPATTGITVTGGKPVAGEQIILSADGFQPGETGILVVVYSTPTVLDANATADASGRLVWTGRLPAGLTGKHTITFQGSVDRGVEVEIAPGAIGAAEGCLVEGATLTWGFKESFRSYISGAIAHGQWTVAEGATYETPSFGWNDGSGAYDDPTGLVAFAGSVAFSGHDGALSTTIANPQLRFVDADTAVLLLDVAGTTQDGSPIDQQDVEFVEIDLAGATRGADGAITVTDAPTVLTSAGAAAFGTYGTGEAFDPISFTVPVEDCAEPAVRAETEVVEVAPAAAAADLSWVWALAGIVLALIAAAIVIVMVRRRRTA